MRLVFASPTYGPVEPSARNAQMAAIMRAAGNGITWVGPCSPDKLKFDAARNRVVQEVLAQEDVDGIFWCDSDIILPTDAVRIAQYGHDFVSGFYYQKAPPYWPLIANRPNGSHGFQWIVEWPASAMIQVDGCGFGCVYTSTRMLRALAPPHFLYDKWGEDFDFCVKARAAGFQLWADTGIQCGHLPSAEPITSKHYQDCRAELLDAARQKVGA